MPQWKPPQVRRSRKRPLIDRLNNEEYIRKHYKKDKSAGQIGKILGIPRGTVLTIAKKLGLNRPEDNASNPMSPYNVNYNAPNISLPKVSILDLKFRDEKPDPEINKRAWYDEKEPKK